VDVHASLRRPIHRQPQLSKLFAGVEERVAIRRGQDAVNRDMLMKQIDDVAQCLLDLDIVRPDCLERDEVTEASSFLMR
jgi:hypothetical protein